MEGNCRDVGEPWRDNLIDHQAVALQYLQPCFIERKAVGREHEVIREHT